MINFNAVALNAFKKWASVTPNLLSSIEFTDDNNRKIFDDFEKAVHKALLSEEKKYRSTPKTWHHLDISYKYIEGYVRGNLAVAWSYRYLPPNPRTDYQLWMLTFRKYLAVDQEARLRINRLTCLAISF